MNNLNIKEFNCSSCGLCSNVCPVSAIRMNEESGFIKYEIDEKKCINCGLCLKKCPQLNIVNSNNKVLKCYSVYSKDKKILKKSSSGGVFAEIAKSILKDNGVVVGATFEDNKVKHILIDKEEDLHKIMGSKYLQSYTGNIYKLVKESLKDKRKVLFCGTPCQCAALNNFIKDDNLYILDLVCHGVPSYEEFRKSLKDRFNVNLVRNVEFRNKKKGWNEFYIKYNMGNKNIFIKNYYDDFFDKYLKNSLLNDSCYDCKYSKKERQGDITLSDFWGIDKVDKEFALNNNNLGVSGILINNKKGEVLFEGIKENVIYKEQDFKMLEKYNPRISNGKYDDKFKKAKDDFKNMNYKYTFDRKKEIKDFILNNKISRGVKKVIRLVTKKNSNKR